MEARAETARHNPAQSAKQRRLTSQRRVILEYIRTDGTHPNADRIFQAVVKRLPHISFATVYRNLNFLRDHGYIQELVVNRVSRFEGRVDAHAHLICQSCGTISELEDANLFRSARQLTATQRFKPLSETLAVLGYCRACQERGVIEQQQIERQCEACGKVAEEIILGGVNCQSCGYNSSCHYYASRNA